MQFDDPAKMASVLYGMKQSEVPRSANRARINALFNGNPPFTEREARENRVNCNVNFLEPTKIAQDARTQYYNAFIRPGNYFTVKLDGGPPEKRQEWGHIITRNINRVLKDSLPYTQLLQQTFAQMVLHGIGPVFWPKRQKWMPEFIGIDELLIPSGVKMTLENLDYFAIHRRYSLNELCRMTSGDAVDKGWNMKLVNQLKEKLRNRAGQPGNIPQWQFFEYERMEEDYKSNSGYWASDQIPTVSTWDVYYCKDEEGNSEKDEYGWCRKMMLDTDCDSGSATTPEFLFDPKERVYASELDHLLHINFADGANVAPFRYHSVRSLGFMLYAVCHLQNRLRCRWNDSVFESLMWFFRDVNDGTAERLERIDLQHLGLIPEGVNFVPSTERHRVDFPLVQGAFAMNRQLMSENSSAFTRDINDGTQKELTATEVMARVNSASSMVGGMLNLAYTYQKHQYCEIARRFCLDISKNSDADKDIKTFQRRCIMEGLPPAAFNSDMWIIDVERTVGNGNKTLELAQTERLISRLNLFDPDAQRLILHIFAESTVDDPYLAERLVPIQGQHGPSEAMEVASLAWGSLIASKPIVVARGINEIEYVETLLHDLNMDIDQIENTGASPEMPHIAGLANVIQHITQHVALIAQNEQEGPRVKQYGDQLKNASNYVRAYAQRAQERAQAQGQGMDPAVMAKVQSMIIEANAKAEISRDLAAQKMAQKDAAFVRDQSRRDAKTVKEIQTQDVKTAAEIQQDQARTIHEVRRDNSVALADVARDTAIAAAQPPTEQGQ